MGLGKRVNPLLCTNSIAQRLRKRLIVNICKESMPLTFSERRDCCILCKSCILVCMQIVLGDSVSYKSVWNAEAAMQAKWLVFPCSYNETTSTGELGRERAWFVKKHQEERRKSEILLKCCPTSRKLCVHATVLPCVFDDLRSIQHYFIFL